MAAEKVTLHGLPVSPYYQRAAVALLECGVEAWETVPVNPLTGETKAPSFLALNPLGKIPVYQDADVTLFESRAIARYLFDKFPQAGEELMGKDAKERGEVNQWVDVEATSYTPAIAPIIGETLIKKLMGKPVDEARLQEHVAKVGDILDVYEKHLEKHSFFACGRLTWADLSHLPHTAMLEAAGFGELLSSRPHVAKWWALISSRPSWAKVEEGPTIPKLVAAKEEQKEG